MPLITFHYQALMKKAILLIMNVLLTGMLFGQVRSIAIINDVDDKLFLLKQKFLSPKFDVNEYKCDTFNQTKYAGEVMFWLLKGKYEVEMIELPAEYRKDRGLFTRSAKKWFKSMSGRYDVVIYLYSMTKENERLFGYSSYPLYSSGLFSELGTKINQSRVYTSVTARAYSTKTGMPFHHLDNYFDNATATTLNKIIFFTDINDPEVCKTVPGIIKNLIVLRYKEFVEGFEYVTQDWE